MEHPLMDNLIPYINDMNPVKFRDTVADELCEFLKDNTPWCETNKERAYSGRLLFVSETISGVNRSELYELGFIRAKEGIEIRGLNFGESAYTVSKFVGHWYKKHFDK